MEGDLNFFLYYERVLSDDEILQIYNGTRRRFQIMEDLVCVTCDLPSLVDGVCTNQNCESN